MGALRLFISCCRYSLGCGKNKICRNIFQRIVFVFIFTLLLACKGAHQKADIENKHSALEKSQGAVYHLLLDRFVNGDERNDDGDADLTLKNHYHGGDFRGLQEKLPYLKSLGVSALWINPIMKNYSPDRSEMPYHGYWISGFDTIDPHWGSEADFNRLLDAAHAQDMHVYLDIVVNHTADMLRYDVCHENSVQPIYQAECPYRDLSQAPYTAFSPAGMPKKSPAWLNDIGNYSLRGESVFEGESSLWGDFFGLDDINTVLPVVKTGMAAIYKDWISRFPIDGFRVDTVKHVDRAFWADWVPEMVQHAKNEGRDNFQLFGEVFDGDPRTLAQSMEATTFPSLLDFGLYYGLRDAVAGKVGTQRLADLFQWDDVYNVGNKSAQDLYTFVSNHDVGRLSHEIQKAWPEETDSQHLARLKMAYALIHFARGIPIIYYGDEQGLRSDGNYDNARESLFASQVPDYLDNDLVGTDNTHEMDLFDESHPLFMALQSYQALRGEHPALTEGPQVLRYSDNEPGVLAFSRFDNARAREYLVVFNTASTVKRVALTAKSRNFQPDLMGSSATLESDEDTDAGNYQLIAPPLSVAIFPGDTPEIDIATLPNQLSVSESPTAPRKEGPSSYEVILGDTFEVQLPVADAAFYGLIAVNFYLLDDDNENAVLLARDNNPPYRAHMESSHRAVGERIQVYAEIEHLGEADRDKVRTAVMDLTFIEAPPNVEAPLTLTFKKPLGWGETINIYYWDAAPAPSVDWPGVPMTPMESGGYRFIFPPGVTASHVIFNDGTHQTADLYRDADGCFGGTGILPDDWLDTCDFSQTVSQAGMAAHWISASQILWAPRVAATQTAKLLYSHDASLAVNASAITGNYDTLPLEAGASGLSDQSPLSPEVIMEKYPHLASFTEWQLSLPADPISAASLVHQALKAQLWVVGYDEKGQLTEATAVQIPGVLDALFASDEHLGLQFDEFNRPHLAVWAPTAISVRLKLYNAQLNILDTHDATSVSQGIYHFDGDASWDAQYYRYEVTVYHPMTENIETYEVTDPYSISLSQNGEYSQIINVAENTELIPPGWSSLKKSLSFDDDIVIYEGHVRDFSIVDNSVAEMDRGKYAAFKYSGKNADFPLSHGMKHLKILAEAGLTHFHLLPVNDIATINEDENSRIELTTAFSEFCEQFVSQVNIASNTMVMEQEDTHLIKECETPEGTLLETFQTWADNNPATPLIQHALAYIQGLDGFNWGYDPHHFMVPEGSYTKNPQGAARIRALRDMVMGLHEVGLKTVVDVVFNHTSASGVNRQSVLDRLVPGYYHRLDPVTGNIARSTCCENTAAEHSMMEKLMVDSVLFWAKHYKIDGFRFDLMGHHPKSVMETIKNALASLTLEADGVDGQSIYLYGEGWDFGEVSGDQRFIQATQKNMAGTGIGTFNDRLRDAVRGGNFSNNGAAQGWASGNGIYMNGRSDEQTNALNQGDRIRIGLAGNLRSYTFLNHLGQRTNGENFEGVGYNAAPRENVLYVDKHDNESLWDNTQGKLPYEMPLEQRVKVHLLSQAFVNYGQGVPFHQMGSDLLRAKSMDRNSYNSGDWFNAVDFTGRQAIWAQGLPPEQDNRSQYPAIEALFEQTHINPTAAAITQARRGFQQQLTIRKSSPLFRVPTATAIQKRVGFWNTGTDAIPGLVAMSISDGQCSGDDIDPHRDGLIVIFNAANERRTFELPAFKDLALTAHPLDITDAPSSFDAANAEFHIAPLSAVVFEQSQGTNVGRFPCNPEDGVILEPGITMYLKLPEVNQPTPNVSPETWTNPHLYFWDTSPVNTRVEWPGEAMLSLGNGWFRWAFPEGVSESKIIFNNTQGEQTNNLYREGAGCFYLATQSWQNIEDCALPGMTVYFKKPSTWENTLHIYYWEVDGPSPEWPGTPMNLVEEQDDWYSFQFPSGIQQSRLIFNDAGSHQTGDLYREGSGCYADTLAWEAPCPH